MEGIRPETLEIAACKGCKNILYTLDKYFQGRLFAPLIPPGFDALVNAPEHVRSHVVIEHPQEWPGEHGFSSFIVACLERI
jgi:hypothetical protein